MRLKISHTSEYRYTESLQYGLQRLHLVPRNGAGQSVRSWQLEYQGAREEAHYVDHFGNDTRLASASPGVDKIVIKATGEIETTSKDGILGPHKGYAPLWLFQTESELTAPGTGIEKLLAELTENGELDRMHQLMSLIGERVQYEVGTTDVATSAEAALQQGSGVCQDHAHIFIAAARASGLPARYISGYLMRDDTAEQAASHAWAEAHLDGLGWVGFDVSNGISPDERYVRIATGRDYNDAMPIAGIRFGPSEESLAVHISVEQ